MESKTNVCTQTSLLGVFTSVTRKNPLLFPLTSGVRWITKRKLNGSNQIQDCLVPSCTHTKTHMHANHNLPTRTSRQIDIFLYPSHWWPALSVHKPKHHMQRLSIRHVHMRTSHLNIVVDISKGSSGFQLKDNHGTEFTRRLVWDDPGHVVRLHKWQLGNLHGCTDGPAL